MLGPSYYLECIESFLTNLLTNVIEEKEKNPLGFSCAFMYNFVKFVSLWYWQKLFIQEPHTVLLMKIIYVNHEFFCVVCQHFKCSSVNEYLLNPTAFFSKGKKHI